MNNFTKFINKYFNLAVLSLLLILLLRNCSSDNKAVNKRIEALSQKIDTLNKTSVTHQDLQIEGLRTEKRMIQSTDRKIIDVNRQSEIDKELNELSK